MSYLDELRLAHKACIQERRIGDAAAIYSKINKLCRSEESRVVKDAEYKRECERERILIDEKLGDSPANENPVLYYARGRK